MLGAVDDIVVHNRSSSSTDGEFKQVITTTDTTVRGSVHQLTERESMAAAQFAPHASVIVRVPLETVVSSYDYVTLAATPGGVWDGDWEIDFVKGTPKHLRLYLHRTELGF
jgi:hypothetical protein